MADKPISYSGPMVRALLQDRKTQTRRLLKPRGFRFFEHPVAGWRYEQSRKIEGDTSVVGGGQLDYEAMRYYLPYLVGDRLYVREHWRVAKQYDVHAPVSSKSGGPVLKPRGMTVLFEAGGSIANQPNGKWEPDPHPLPSTSRPAWAGKFRQAMHMPRWASRITLTVTDVRLQRLHDISYADCIAEGVEMESADPPFYWVPGLDAALTAVGVEEPGGNHAQRCYFKLLDHLHGAGFSSSNPWLVAYSFTVAMGNIDVA